MHILLTGKCGEEMLLMIVAAHLSPKDDGLLATLGTRA
jgi:hypothetical protein